MIKFAHLTGDVKDWAKRLVTDLNRPASDYVGGLSAYANDAAAAAAGIPIGGGYRKTDGTVRWRVS